MIRVFRATDYDYSSNGEVIIKPYSAAIIKNQEEEYIEVEAPLKYAEFLIEENVLIVDTPYGKRGYKIRNPQKEKTIKIKGLLCYQEATFPPTDRGLTISYGKNLQDCTVTENWDEVVTKLIPIGHNGIRLPEGYLSVPTPYQIAYEREIEFELSEELEEQVEILEDGLEDQKALVESLKNSFTTITAKVASYDRSIADLQNEKTNLTNRLSELGESEPELKEKAVIEAQLLLIDDEISKMQAEKVQLSGIMENNRVELETKETELATMQSSYNGLLIVDLRNQAEEYLRVNQYPKIHYQISAYVKDVVEVGDIVHVKHPKMLVDILASVTAYELNLLTQKYDSVEIGNHPVTLKSKFSEVEKKIEDASKQTERLDRNVTKRYSELKKTNEEIVSTFIEEIYGANNGIYGLLQKNTSIFRQTAAEISGTVTRVNANLSQDIASVKLRADQIEARVTSNFTTLDGKIADNTASITLTASQIRSEVTSTLSNYSTTQQMNSSITQTAQQVRSEISASVSGLVTSYQLNTAITQSTNSITSQVSQTYLTKSAASTTYASITKVTTVEQTAEKISWLVNSGTSSSNFTLTDRVASLISAKLNINSFVTFTNLSTVNTTTTINGGNIRTGTFDCSKLNVINLSAASITSGTLSADRISGGTFDGNKMDIKNIDARSITSGWIEVGYIRANGYSCMSVGSSNTLVIGGTSSYYDITGVHILPTRAIFGSSSGTVGFFGKNGAYRRTVSNISTSSTLVTAITTLNSLLSVLREYGLIN